MAKLPDLTVYLQKFSSLVVITFFIDYLSSSPVHGHRINCPSNGRTPKLSQYSSVKETGPSVAITVAYLSSLWQARFWLGSCFDVFFNTLLTL